MLENFKHALVLAPHTDDGELGCGGTIARLVQSNCKVTYVAFSTAEASLKPDFPLGTLKVEVREATKILGIESKNLIVLDYKVRHLNYVRQEILETLIKIKKNNNIDLVLMPSLRDIHQDHSTVSTEAVRAFKDRTIFGYELIWNNLKFDSVCFVQLDEMQLDIKCKALRAYRSQAGKAYFNVEFIKSMARVRGAQIGVDYAECFEVVRHVL